MHPGGGGAGRQHVCHFLRELLHSHAFCTLELSTSDCGPAGISILAGATLGGGTRVNWQASFRTPAHVRREWAGEHGLEAFNSPRYDRALDAVWQRIGVTTGMPAAL